ncbi:MAG: hypothetical protein ACXVPU_15365 [Bacteroidia bacterium]
MRKIFKKEKHEIPFEDILIKDLYELKLHDKSALGYVFVCGIFFFRFAEELFLNPGSGKMPFIIFGSLTLLSVLRFFIARTKIFIPTKKDGLIRIWKNTAGKKRLKELIYVLEGKVNLASKKIPAKNDLSEFISK